MEIQQPTPTLIHDFKKFAPVCTQCGGVHGKPGWGERPSDRVMIPAWCCVTCRAVIGLRVAIEWGRFLIVKWQRQTI